MPSDTDALSAALADIRERSGRLRRYGGSDADVIAACDADVPRLLAAVEVALALHAGSVNDDYPQETPMCGECSEWMPCSTVKAIASALTGTDATS